MTPDRSSSATKPHPLSRQPGDTNDILRNAKGRKDASCVDKKDAAFSVQKLPRKHFVGLRGEREEERSVVNSRQRARPGGGSKQSAVSSELAEMEGFEPPRRRNRPTGFRIRTLQPLGYISICTFRKAPLPAASLAPRRTVSRSGRRGNPGGTRTRRPPVQRHYATFLPPMQEENAGHPHAKTQAPPPAQATPGATRRGWFLFRSVPFRTPSSQKNAF